MIFKSPYQFKPVCDGRIEGLLAPYSSGGLGREGCTSFCIPIPFCLHLSFSDHALSNRSCSDFSLREQQSSQRSELLYWLTKAARLWIPVQAAAGRSGNSHSRHMRWVGWVQPSFTDCPQALFTSRNCSWVFSVSRSLKSLIRFPLCQVP